MSKLEEEQNTETTSKRQVLDEADILNMTLSELDLGIRKNNGGVL